MDEQKDSTPMRWLSSVASLGQLETMADRRKFLLNQVCYAACIEGLFFFGAFAYVLSGGGVGLSLADMRRYLEFCADQRFATLGLPKLYGATNPFSFMELQDVQEMANFFERRVSAYQVAVSGAVSLDAVF